MVQLEECCVAFGSHPVGWRLERGARQLGEIPRGPTIGYQAEPGTMLFARRLQLECALLYRRAKSDRTL